MDTNKEGLGLIIVEKDRITRAQETLHEIWKTMIAKDKKVARCKTPGGSMLITESELNDAINLLDTIKWVEELK